MKFLWGIGLVLLIPSLKIGAMQSGNLLLLNCTQFKVNYIYTTEINGIYDQNKKYLGGIYSQRKIQVIKPYVQQVLNSQLVINHENIWGKLITLYISVPALKINKHIQIRELGAYMVTLNQDKDLEISKVYIVHS